jgi:hypothetical protein
MQRSDWSQFERAFDFVADPSEALSGTSTNGTNGVEGVWSGTGSIRGLGAVGNLKDRFAATSVTNRLSTMMRDLENIRLGGNNSAADGGASSSNVANTASEMGRLGLHPMALSFASANR